MVNPPSTTTMSMIPTTVSIPATPTLQERLAMFGIPNITDAPVETTAIVVTLLMKLEIQDGILIVVFARSNLKRFCKKIISSYMPAKWKKNRATYHAAYKAFYEDTNKKSPFAEAASHIRKSFTTGAEHFANVCTSFYERASKLIHNLTEVYNSAYSTTDLLRLLTHIPKLDENEHRALHAITSLIEIR
ncbi:uncharacterized protein LOC135846567 [Planococcus citri]|uniref:uncharacterized protein LOC135846567 n=1 Tax=Planococcus citri TaxID=170843 RepID=UPI0031F94448